MDALPQIPQGWVNGLFAAFGALVFWVYRKLDGKVEKISGEYATRKELVESEARIMAAIQKSSDLYTSAMQLMHSDNSRGMDGLRTELQLVNSKLFDLASRLPK